jgi:hypothetical protein
MEKRQRPGCETDDSYDCQPHYPDAIHLSAQRTRFQLRRPSGSEGGVCRKPELGSASRRACSVSRTRRRYAVVRQESLADPVCRFS